MENDSVSGGAEELFRTKSSRQLEKSCGFDCSCLLTGRHSVTDDTLTLQVEHLVLFEVTIATTTQQHRMSIMLTSL